MPDIAVDAAFRFLLDFTRYYDSTSAIGSLGGLSFNMNQVLSGALILLSLAMLAILARRPVAPDATAPAVAGDPVSDAPGSAPTA